MWFEIIVFTGLLAAGRSLFARMVLKEETGSLAYALVQQVLAVALALPLLFFNWQVPKAVLPFILLILVGVWDTLTTYLIAESFRLLDVSLRNIIYQSQIIWTVLFGFVFLNETLGFRKLIGVLLIFGGIVLASFRKEKIGRLRKMMLRLKGEKTIKERGVLLTITTAFITSFELIVFRYLLYFFSAAVMVAVVASVSTIIFGLMIPNWKKEVVRLPRLAFLNGLIGGVTFFLFCFASSMTEVGRTLAITRAFNVLTVILGIVFLKEREQIGQKIVGGILAAIGVVLVKAS